jgi:hypothetical protein
MTAMNKTTSPLRQEISRAARARLLNWQAIEQARLSRKRSSRNGNAKLDEGTVTAPRRPGKPVGKA